jgi:hypothetical protein
LLQLLLPWQALRVNGCRAFFMPILTVSMVRLNARQADESARVRWRQTGASRGVIGTTIEHALFVLAE